MRSTDGLGPTWVDKSFNLSRFGAVGVFFRVEKQLRSVEGGSVLPPICIAGA